MDDQPLSASTGQTLHSWRKLAAALKGITPAGYLRAGLVRAAARSMVNLCRAALFTVLNRWGVAYLPRLTLWTG
jgi:hypothetical protein